MISLFFWHSPLSWTVLGGCNYGVLYRTEAGHPTESCAQPPSLQAEAGKHARGQGQLVW